MFISQALAHGTTGSEPTGGLGPFIIFGVAILFVLVLVAEKKWRVYRQGRDATGRADGEVKPDAGASNDFT